MSTQDQESIPRREFLVRSALTGGAAALSQFNWTANIAASPSSAEDVWFDRPMRWAQLTLVENDPGQYDPQFWLDYFKRIHADAVCLSAGGAVAYYPTKIQLHHRSQWMKESDPFGELLAGCRKMNMVVLARTDPHAVHQDAYDAHPDWIAVDAEGRKRRHWASPELWVTCALGPYNFEFMTEVHKEIMARYQVDGIFSNRWAGSGMCYCEHCQRNFKAASGLELPRTNDPQNPAQRNYIQWKQQRLFELWRQWDAELRKLNPNSRYIANSGGGALSSLDMKTIGETIGNPVFRQTGPARADDAVGQRQKRQGIPRDDGPQSHRRYLQRRRGRTLPLEGLRPKRSRNSHLGGGRNPPMACARGSRNFPARSMTIAG